MSFPKRQLECTIPVLPVANLKNALRFYTQQLGFTVDWESDVIGSVSRDACHIMLRETLQPSGGVWAWIGVEDDSLFHEFKERGVTVLQGPRNFSWAYEMKFADPDGNVLWLGTECRADLPRVDGH